MTAATLDRLVEGELDALDQTAAALAILAEPGDTLVARRLEERLHEIAHTVLLLVAAQRRSPAVARAAVAWRHARGPHERARTLAVIEAALPRVLVRRLVDAVDELSPAERAAAHAGAGRPLPSRDAAVRAELTGRDRLSRALVLHALAHSDRGASAGHAGASRDDAELAAYRGAITEAARVEALAASPTELMRRLARAVDTDPEGATDMPTRVGDADRAGQGALARRAHHPPARGRRRARALGYRRGEPRDRRCRRSDRRADRRRRGRAPRLAIDGSRRARSSTSSRASRRSPHPRT